MHQVGHRLSITALLQYIGSVLLLQCVPILADGKVFSLESKNGSQLFDLQTARESCAAVGSRLASAEDLRRAVLECSFNACTTGWLANNIVGTTVCRKMGNGHQSMMKAVNVNIESPILLTEKYNAFCVTNEEKPCGDPPSFPHTILHGHTGFEMGDELLYICSQGYVMGSEESAFTLLCDSCGEWYGHVQACVKDETEAHIDYEDNFNEDKDIPDIESNDDFEDDQNEDEDEDGFSFNEEQRANLEEASDMVIASKAPTESPVSMLSQKHLFWFPPELLSKPEAELEPFGATKTQFQFLKSDNHIGIKPGYADNLDRLHFDNEDFPVGPPIKNNITKATNGSTVNTGSSWPDGHVLIQAVDDVEKVDISVEKDLFSFTTYPPKLVKLKDADLSTSEPNSALNQLSASAIEKEQDTKGWQKQLTTTSVDSQVVSNDDMIPYHPTTFFGFVKDISSATSIDHDLTESTTTVKGSNDMPFPTGLQDVPMYPTPAEIEFTIEQDSESYLEENAEEIIIYGTSQPCFGEYCPQVSKGPLIAIIVVIMCLFLLSSIIAIWCYKRQQQKSSVYNMNGKILTRHCHQIEMEKI